MTESERLKFYEEELGLELKKYSKLEEYSQKLNSLRVIKELEVNYRNLKNSQPTKSE